MPAARNLPPGLIAFPPSVSTELPALDRSESDDAFHRAS
jgi:hypothetical protein